MSILTHSIVHINSTEPNADGRTQGFYHTVISAEPMQQWCLSS